MLFVSFNKLCANVQVDLNFKHNFDGLFGELEVLLKPQYFDIFFAKLSNK